ncbi:MAG: winged helix-turn-helix domain-containing protein [Paludibacteraceae bacterium]|jgi:hypothetical protein|nr:winged helix-turn-helix domain-containing protein [Paludibacteraceae bacterium]HOI26359.1 winged helix-turn-helix domain-containing protein [Paludibacteraceae bacterium]
MTNKEIGETAGCVWRLLDEKKGNLTFDQIKKELKKVKKEELYIAIGWLCREDKLECCVKDEKETFCLK